MVAAAAAIRRPWWIDMVLGRSARGPCRRTPATRGSRKTDDDVDWLAGLASRPGQRHDRRVIRSTSAAPMHARRSKTRPCRETLRAPCRRSTPNGSIEAGTPLRGGASTNFTPDELERPLGHQRGRSSGRKCPAPGTTSWAASSPWRSKPAAKRGPERVVLADQQARRHRQASAREAPARARGQSRRTGTTGTSGGSCACPPACAARPRRTPRPRRPTRSGRPIPTGSRSG